MKTAYKHDQRSSEDRKQEAALAARSESYRFRKALPISCSSEMTSMYVQKVETFNQLKEEKWSDVSSIIASPYGSDLYLQSSEGKPELNLGSPKFYYDNILEKKVGEKNLTEKFPYSQEAHAAAKMLAYAFKRNLWIRTFSAIIIQCKYRSHAARNRFVKRVKVRIDAACCIVKFASRVKKRSENRRAAKDVKLGIVTKLQCFARESLARMELQTRREARFLRVVLFLQRKVRANAVQRRRDRGIFKRHNIHSIRLQAWARGCTWRHKKIRMLCAKNLFVRIFRRFFKRRYGRYIVKIQKAARRYVLLQAVRRMQRCSRKFVQRRQFIKKHLSIASKESARFNRELASLESIIDVYSTIEFDMTCWSEMANNKPSRSNSYSSTASTSGRSKAGRPKKPVVENELCTDNFGVEFWLSTRQEESAAILYPPPPGESGPELSIVRAGSGSPTTISSSKKDADIAVVNSKSISPSPSGTGKGIGLSKSNLSKSFVSASASSVAYESSYEDYQSGSYNEEESEADVGSVQSKGPLSSSISKSASFGKTLAKSKKKPKFGFSNSMVSIESLGSEASLDEDNFGFSKQGSGQISKQGSGIYSGFSKSMVSQGSMVGFDDNSTEFSLSKMQGIGALVMKEKHNTAQNFATSGSCSERDEMGSSVISGQSDTNDHVSQTISIKSSKEIDKILTLPDPIVLDFSQRLVMAILRNFVDFQHDCISHFALRVCMANNYVVLQQPTSLNEKVLDGLRHTTMCSVASLYMLFRPSRSMYLQVAIRQSLPESLYYKALFTQMWTKFKINKCIEGINVSRANDPCLHYCPHCLEATAFRNELLQHRIGQVGGADSDWSCKNNCCCLSWISRKGKSWAEAEKKIVKMSKHVNGMPTPPPARLKPSSKGSKRADSPKSDPSSKPDKADKSSKSKDKSSKDKSSKDKSSKDKKGSSSKKPPIAPSNGANSNKKSKKKK